MLKKFWKLLIKFLVVFFAASVLLVIVYRFAPVPFTLLMIERCVQQQLSGKEIRLEKKWVSLDEIDNNLQLAVITSEDQNFLFHHGFDFGAIQKAMAYNEKQKTKKKQLIEEK